jgi:hypothetical protein
VAEENKRDGIKHFSCVNYQNNINYSSSKTIHTNPMRSGLMPKYNCWTKHRERGVIIEDNEEEEDDNNYPMFPEIR